MSGAGGLLVIAAAKFCNASLRGQVWQERNTPAPEAEQMAVRAD